MLLSSNLLVLATLVFGQCGSLSGVPLPDITSLPPGSAHLADVPYGRNPLDPQTKFHFYKAASPFPTPVIIEAHGGGWAKYSQTPFPTPNAHHPVFGLLLKEALAVIGNDSVRSMVHQVRTPQAMCEAAIEATAWVRDRVRDPLMLTVEDAAKVPGGASEVAPVFRLNLGQIHARDFIDAMKSDPGRNYLQIVLSGPAFSPALTWDNLTTMSDQGLVTVRAERNVIEIEFAPLNLDSFGGALKASFTASRKDFRESSVIRQW